MERDGYSQKPSHVKCTDLLPRKTCNVTIFRSILLSDSSHLLPAPLTRSPAPMMQFTKLTQSRLITLCKFSAAASLAGVGGWQLWTGKCYFEPFGPENDGLFQSEYFKKYNPGNHPSLNDSCVRKVPVSQIPPDLVEDALRGGSKLTERFCAGVWGGYGELATILLISVVLRYAILCDINVARRR